MELVLLQETSITLTELDTMNEERKWLYYYYILAAKEKQNEEVEKSYYKKGQPNKPKKTVLDFKIKHPKIEEEIKRKNEQNPEIGTDPK